MANYIIIGGDQKEYGPISTSDVRQWIAEGRLNEESLMKAESDAQFRALGKFPEFADAFVPKAATPSTPPPLAGATSSDTVTEREYDLDIFGSFSRGWELVKNNMGLLFVGALIYLFIQLVMGALGSIPVIGSLFSLANFIISGPLMGGLLYLFLRAIRSESAEIGDVFSGFRRAFGQLFLGAFIQALFIGLCLLPFIIFFLVKFFPLMGHLEHLQPGTPPDPETIRALTSVFLTCLPVLVICAIPAIYLSVSWKFTLPLIIDKQLGFWAAMQTSRRQVGKHWWQVFGLLILIGLLNTAGVFLCCVGMLFTFPIGIAALMFAYETIFPEGPAA
ncbi:MAG: DUF975 family protein [Limisphaerales bacterium]